MTLNDLIARPDGHAKELAQKAESYKYQLAHGQITQVYYDRLMNDLKAQAEQYRLAAEEESRNDEAQALQMLIGIIVSKVL